MLAFEPRIRFARKFHSPHTADPEAGFAQPRQPIPVVLARDEELGSHDDNTIINDEEEDDTDRALPPPPPAYGLWRSSVVSLPFVLPMFWLASWRYGMLTCLTHRSAPTRISFTGKWSNTTTTMTCSKKQER